MNGELPVPVVVDPETGVWTVDGMPMVLVPRHFWVAVQKEGEAALGIEGYAEVLERATRWAAYRWCEREAKAHGLSGLSVFRHYMRRMSRRGWGQIAVEAIDSEAGTARIAVEHSVFVAEYGPDAGRNVCHMFNGAFGGGMEFVAAEAGRRVALASREIECAANGAARCLFEVAPATA